MTPKSRRRALTLVEVLVSAAILAVLLLVIWRVFRAGRRGVASNDRKLTNLQAAHLRFESLRHDLASAAFAWVPPPAPVAAGGDPLGGGHHLVAGAREYAYDPASRGLAVSGRRKADRLDDLRFWAEDDHRLKFLVRATGDDAVIAGREHATLVSKVFLETQAEEDRARRHVWEVDHGWCVSGGSMHYGFTE